MPDVIKELEQLKQRIEKVKADKSHAEGRLAAEFERLEKNYGIKTINEIVEKLKVLVAEKSQLDDQLKLEWEKLKGEYEW